MNNNKWMRAGGLVVVGIILLGVSSAGSVGDTAIGNIITIFGGVMIVAGLVLIFKKQA